MGRRDWRFADESLTAVIATGGRARGRQRVPGQMNKLEQKYSQHLELRRTAGEILWWAFEGIKFRLGDDCFYTPDFDVMLASLEMQFHDVKGTTRRKAASGHIHEIPYYEEDARVKIATANTMFPFSFQMVWLTSDGNWKAEER